MPFARSGRAERCDNRNHARSNSPVRNCPKCGGVVNRLLSVKKCSEAEHGAYRRHQYQYCVDCGDQLIAAR